MVCCLSSALGWIRGRGRGLMTVPGDRVFRTLAVFGLWGWHAGELRAGFFYAGGARMDLAADMGPASRVLQFGRCGRPRIGPSVYRSLTLAGGSEHSHPGGGANYVCLPKVPQYMSTHVPSARNYMYGAEYEGVNGIFPGKHEHNVPCAVCYTSTKAVKLMIPAQTSCPSSWTVEYKGYLMTDRWNHKRNAVYECVDESPESISGSHANINGALFYFTLSTCTGLPCPPYVNNRPITCVVCTK